MREFIFDEIPQQVSHSARLAIHETPIKVGPAETESATGGRQNTRTPPLCKGGAEGPPAPCVNAD